MNFLEIKDQKLSLEFKKKGYLIKKIKDLDSLKYIKKKILVKLKKNIKKKQSIKEIDFLNKFHKYSNSKDLNKIRLNIFNKLNEDLNFKKSYFNISKNILDTLVGNELVMQKKINLSIQTPNDKSSLLPVHADTWSGLSPFEVVVWLPLVDCYKTKSMYILQPKYYKKFIKNMNKVKFSNSERIFSSIKKDIDWLDIKFGEVLIFNQQLPHGNVPNIERDTRWSMNCRFKSIFSPYADKKIGEFYEPITLRPITELGFKYQLPKFK